MKNKIKLFGNKKTPSDAQGFDVGRNSFDGGVVPIGNILTFLIIKYQSISKTLFTAVESTVSHLALIVASNKKQFIVSVIRGLTPRTGRQTYWNRCRIMGKPSTVDTIAGKGGSFNYFKSYPQVYIKLWA